MEENINIKEELHKANEKALKEVVNVGIQIANVDYLNKLLEMEEKIMRYSDYDGYGRRYDAYGRRGYDAKYRGEEYMNRMHDNYGRYEDGRAYGHRDESIKSLEYMLESMVDFVKMLREDADNQEEMDLIRRYTRKISEM